VPSLVWSWPRDHPRPDGWRLTVGGCAWCLVLGGWYLVLGAWCLVLHIWWSVRSVRLLAAPRGDRLLVARCCALIVVRCWCRARAPASAVVRARFAPRVSATVSAAPGSCDREVVTWFGRTPPTSRWRWPYGGGTVRLVATGGSSRSRLRGRCRRKRAVTGAPRAGVTPKGVATYAGTRTAGVLGMKLALTLWECKAGPGPGRRPRPAPGPARPLAPPGPWPRPALAPPGPGPARPLAVV